MPQGVRFDNHLPSRDQFWELFASTGWNAEYRLSADELLRAIAESWRVVSAYDGDQLVGFGRVVSDGILHAMIYDLIVDPRHQRKGIGAKILQILVTSCCDAHVRDIQLFCAEGKRTFYEKQGFKGRHEGAPGMEYAGPRLAPVDKRP